MNPPNIVAQQACLGLRGNPDLYGLGIRIGIYLQWISSLLTNVFLPSSVSDSLDTNSIFLFAVFIAVANATKSAGVEPLLGPIGGFVMLQMCFGYVLSVMSITGLRIKLLSNPDSIDTELFTAHLLKHSIWARSLSIENKKAALQKMWKISKSEKPEALTISKYTMASFRCCDTLAFASLSNDLSIEPVTWFADLYVFIALQLQIDASESPEQEYIRSRLHNYQAIRTAVRNAFGDHIFTLGVSSVYKHDHFSWLGVCWRLLLIGGIAIYNVWYWFAGVSYLNTNSCDMFIFLFAKVSILGASQIFFKVLSIIYAVYAGIFLIVGLWAMLGFYQTLIRSLMINFLILPYAKFLLILASLGSSNADTILDGFDKTQTNFMQWLELPTIRQTLCGYAYLCSNPKRSSPRNGAQQSGESSPRDEVQPNLQRSNSASSRRFHTFRITLIAILSVIIVLIVITIELTLKFNQVSGVYDINSTGQLIPFVIGIVSMGKTLNALWVEMIKKVWIILATQSYWEENMTLNQHYTNWDKIEIGMNARNMMVIRDLPATQDIPLQDDI